jgi:hypothetical protein
MATRVTGPHSTTPEAVAEDTARHRDTGGTLVNPIGPNQLDGPRVVARESGYRNSTDEREMIAAIDKAAFDRVRPVEQFFINQAERLAAETTQPNPVNGKPGTIGTADEVITGLYAVVTELERGASASELAERFKSLQNRARQELLPKIARTQHAIETTHLPRLEDPYAAAQDIIAKMPYSSFRPLDPARYIDR